VVIKKINAHFFYSHLLSRYFHEYTFPSNPSRSLRINEKVTFKNIHARNAWTIAPDEYKSEIHTQRLGTFMNKKIYKTARQKTNLDSILFQTQRL
jgi:hypothetical protein